MTKAIMAWSSGKDSAVALHEVLRGGKLEVVSLLSILVEGAETVGMHNVPRALVWRQAESLGLPLAVIRIGDHEADYERDMGRFLSDWKQRGVRVVIFGDLFLEELRAERERRLRAVGLEGLFPLWGWGSRHLMEELIGRGFRAVVTNVDTSRLEASLLGREIDRTFVSELPAEADPCGERGEYHSFVYDGPPFRRPVAFRTGSRVIRDGRFHHLSIEATDQGEV